MPIDEGPRSKPLVVVECGAEDIWFTGFGDQHWGHSGCWKAGVREAIEEIRESGAWWVGMGNMLNCGWAMAKKEAAMEEEMLVDEQFIQFRELLRPIAPTCVGLIGSQCHEGWMESAAGFRLLKLLADNLGVRWLGLNARFVLKVAGQRYRVHAWHGKGAAATLMGKFNPLLRMKEKSDSDLYLMAHIHQCLDYPTYFTEARGDRERQMKRLFVVTGHFQAESNYAEGRDLALGRMGLMWIRLSADKWSAHAGTMGPRAIASMMGSHKDVEEG